MARLSHGEAVTVLTGTPRIDPYSQEETGTDWDTVTTRVVTGVGVAPRASTEPTQDARQAVYTGWTLYLPAGDPITAKNRVTVRGVVHEVVGEPADWRSPFTGWRPGVEVVTRRVEG